MQMMSNFAFRIKSIINLVDVFIGSFFQRKEKKKIRLQASLKGYNTCHCVSIELFHHCRIKQTDIFNPNKKLIAILWLEIRNI